MEVDYHPKTYLKCLHVGGYNGAKIISRRKTKDLLAVNTSNNIKSRLTIMKEEGTLNLTSANF